jgi:hypothetical protein
MCFDATISFTLAIACASTSIIKLILSRKNKPVATTPTPNYQQHAFGLFIACTQLLEFTIWLKHDCGDLINIISSYLLGIVLLMQDLFCVWIICKYTQDIPCPQLIHCFSSLLKRQRPVEIVPTPNRMETTRALVAVSNITPFTSHLPITNPNPMVHVNKKPKYISQTSFNIVKFITCCCTAIFFTSTFIIIIKYFTLLDYVAVIQLTPSSI